MLINKVHGALQTHLMLMLSRKNSSSYARYKGIIMWFKQKPTCPMLATVCTSWCACTKEPCSVHSWCMTCKADLDHLELHSPNLVTRPSAVRLVFAADLQQITIAEKVSKHTECLHNLLQAPKRLWFMFSNHCRVRAWNSA